MVPDDGADDEVDDNDGEDDEYDDEDDDADEDEADVGSGSDSDVCSAAPADDACKPHSESRSQLSLPAAPISLDSASWPPSPSPSVPSRSERDACFVRRTGESSSSASDSECALEW